VRWTTTLKRGALAVLLASGLVLGWYAQSRLLARQRCLRVLAIDPWPATKASASTRAATSLRVATFNIAHARGGEFGASNWTRASKEDLRSRLAKIAQQVSAAGVDVLVLNEVDFEASWSRSIDQAAEVARRAGLRYVVEQRNVDVTFPFRSFRFGNAILSRYPIAKARALHFPALSKREAVLAGNHDGVVAEVLTPIGRVSVVAVHLEYRSEDARLQGARIVKKLVEESTHPCIAMGDFNSIPGFARRHPEHVPSPENAVDLLLSSGVLSVSKAAVDWNRYVTFPSARPDRAIDWILSSSDLAQGVPTVFQSDLSDHLMVAVQLSASRPHARPAS
jgi:endonuclease/exonuclease/phosphatase family metal-dependent hydrolase